VGPTPSSLQAEDFVQLSFVELSLSNFVGTLTSLLDIPHSRETKDVTNFRPCFKSSRNVNFYCVSARLFGVLVVSNADFLTKTTTITNVFFCIRRITFAKLSMKCNFIIGPLWYEHQQKIQEYNSLKMKVAYMFFSN